LAALQRTRNVILYGPPGTGKTYIAKKVAQALVEPRSAVTTQSSDHFIEWVTFHQSFSYEDFVEGWRPVKGEESEQVSYDIVPGTLRYLAARAEVDPAGNYVLVIDEINRGNISKILGELITLIEDDKRKGQQNETAVTLTYSRQKFCLPSNIYIIGTMNTADRSIALLDVALRRRFAFIEIAPHAELLEDVLVGNEESSVDLGALLENLNRGIARELDRNYQLGHSYFLRIKELSDTERLIELEYVWNNQILPLLEEYFYSQREVLAEFLSGFTNSQLEQDSFEIERLTGEDLLLALKKVADS
jgi:5-methylcytosine-specific restriction protein B